MYRQRNCLDSLCKTAGFYQAIYMNQGLPFIYAIILLWSEEDKTSLYSCKEWKWKYFLTWVIHEGIFSNEPRITFFFLNLSITVKAMIIYNRLECLFDHFSFILQKLIDGGTYWNLWLRSCSIQITKV